MFEATIQAQVTVSRRRNGVITVTKYNGYSDSEDDEFRIGFAPIPLRSDPKQQSSDDVLWLTLSRSEAEDLVEALNFVVEPSENDE